MTRLLKIFWNVAAHSTALAVVLLVTATFTAGIFAVGVNAGFADGYVQGVSDNEERRTELHEEYCA